MLLGLASATVFRRRVVRHLRVLLGSLSSMLVRSGCVGPRYGVPTFGGGEGWVGRTLDAFVDALGARKELFGVQGAVGGQGGRI